MNKVYLEFFGPTIHTHWNIQIDNLKTDLMDYMANFFCDTFNQSRAISMTSRYLKYPRDTYRVHLQNNPSYELPPIVLEREWKNILEDANNKECKKNERRHQVEEGI